MRRADYFDSRPTYVLAASRATIKRRMTNETFPFTCGHRQWRTTHRNQSAADAVAKPAVFEVGWHRERTLIPIAFCRLTEASRNQHRVVFTTAELSAVCRVQGGYVCLLFLLPMALQVRLLVAFRQLQ